MFQTGQLASSTIFVITIAVSLFGLKVNPAVIQKCLFRPYWALRKREFDTFYLYGFVHADLGHLLMNMVTFYFFAFPLEARIGTVPFIILYSAGLLAASFASWWQHNEDANYATLGASGAVCAVLFAYIVYDPFSKLFIFPIPIPLPAFLFAFAYLGYTYWASKQAQGRINHDGHLWGALCGLLFVLLSDPRAYVQLASLLG